MASIERECELALINAVSAASVTSYTSEREGGRLLPNLTAKASLTNELLGPFTGVFGLSATLTYTSRADSVSRDGFDHEFSTIVQQLYRSPSLASYMTSNSALKVYKASINSEVGSIIATNRTWKKEINISIQATVSPPLIPSYGLALWLKADAGLTLSGLNVTAWADQSANGKNGTADNGYPTFVSNAINGKPAIQFNGTNARITGSEPMASQVATIFVVGSHLANKEIGMMYQQYNGNDSMAFYRGWYLNPSKTRIYNGVDLSGSANTNLSAYYIYSTIVNLFNSEIYVNGSLDSQGYAGSLTSNGNYYLSYWVGGNAYTNMRITEVIVYNRVITNTERQQIEAYLNTKYAIY